MKNGLVVAGGNWDAETGSDLWMRSILIKEH